MGTMGRVSLSFFRGGCRGDVFAKMIQFGWFWNSFCEHPCETSLRRSKLIWRQVETNHGGNSYVIRCTISPVFWLFVYLRPKAEDLFEGITIVPSSGDHCQQVQGIGMGLYSVTFCSCWYPAVVTSYRWMGTVLGRGWNGVSTKDA